MDARYRIDYPGEFVILETKWSGGKKSDKLKLNIALSTMCSLSESFNDKTLL